MRRGCAYGCSGALLSFVACTVWLNFVLAYERTLAESPDKSWTATAYINGMPLIPENERVHIWRRWQPHFRWLGCQVLEAKNEAPLRLTWASDRRLVIDHGFRDRDLVSFATKCGQVAVTFRRVFAPYS